MFAFRRLDRADQAPGLAGVGHFLPERLVIPLARLHYLVEVHVYHLVQICTLLYAYIQYA